MFCIALVPALGLWGPRWQSGNTLAFHLCGRGSIPVMAVSGKAGSCLPLVGSLQYRTLANYMYWFPLPFQLPVVKWPVQCWKRRKTPIKQNALGLWSLLCRLLPFGPCPLGGSWFSLELDASGGYNCVLRHNSTKKMFCWQDKGLQKLFEDATENLKTNVLVYAFREQLI